MSSTYTLSISILLILLLQSQAQTQSGIARVYFIDVYKSIDVLYPPNNPYLATPYFPVAGYPYIAYPMNRCLLDGNDFAQSGSTSAVWTRYQCQTTGGMGNRCFGFTSIEACGISTSCNSNTPGAASFNFATNTLTYGGGTCSCGGSCANLQGQYYMEVAYYKAFYESNDGCPATPFNSSTNIGYQYFTSNKFATGVCVRQEDNKYILTKCDMFEGDISLYDDAACTSKIQTLLSFNSTCEYFDNPQGEANSPRYFRRFSKCIVNGSNIVAPTPSPTSYPTQTPITSQPSVSPVRSPSVSPSTYRPTTTPTQNPTQSPITAQPTVIPTYNPTTLPPTLKPTAEPITNTESPTPAPTETPTDEKTELDVVADDIMGMSLIQFLIVGLLIIYFCIGCWIFCTERNKRIKILNPGRKGRLKRLAMAKQRIQRKRQKQRNIQMQSMQKDRIALASQSVKKTDHALLNEGIRE